MVAPVPWVSGSGFLPVESGLINVVEIWIAQGFGAFTKHALVVQDVSRRVAAQGSAGHLLSLLGANQFAPPLLLAEDVNCLAGANRAIAGLQDLDAATAHLTGINKPC